MGSKHLRSRENWQTVGGTNAGMAEKMFYDVFLKEFENTDFRIRHKPSEFKNIYEDVILSKAVLAEIYDPKKKWRHGVELDFAIDNVKTEKTLYVEVKRQDGWVEDKKPSAGRGNAHERACKFFTPGLLKILRKQGKLGDEILPFWVVLQGDITRDPKRVREMTCWYDEFSAHFFMWRDSMHTKSLVDHFNLYLKHLLL